MKIIRAYKVRLYPNKEQEAEMLKILAGCRFVWNHFLEIRKNDYLENKKTIPYLKLAKRLTILRKTTPELSELQYVPLAQQLRKLDTAYNRFFRKLANLPKFKTEFDQKQSFEKSHDWKIIGNKIMIQKNLILKTRGELPQNGKTIVISYVARSKWFASITVHEDIKLPKKNTKAIGIDLGITSLATISDGRKFEVRKHNLQFQLAKLQRKSAKQTIGSGRRNQTLIKISRLYNKIANIRKDNLHKVTDSILKKNPKLVVVEDLGIKNMMKNHNLARSIANASWGEFSRQIHYKTKWRGGEVKEINRFYPSSKTCSKCFYVVDSLPLSVREWDCPQCKTTHDRDINASKVILQIGQGMPNVESSRELIEA